MKKPKTIIIYNKKRFLELLQKGLAYDNTYYLSKTTNADSKMIDEIMTQLGKDKNLC